MRGCPRHGANANRPVRASNSATQRKIRSPGARKAVATSAAKRPPGQPGAPDPRSPGGGGPCPPGNRPRCHGRRRQGSRGRRHCAGPVRRRRCRQFHQPRRLIRPPDLGHPAGGDARRVDQEPALLGAESRDVLDGQGKRVRRLLARFSEDGGRRGEDRLPQQLGMHLRQIDQADGDIHDRASLVPSCPGVDILPSPSDRFQGPHRTRGSGRSRNPRTVIQN